MTTTTTTTTPTTTTTTSTTRTAIGSLSPDPDGQGCGHRPECATRSSCCENLTVPSSAAAAASITNHSFSHQVINNGGNWQTSSSNDDTSRCRRCIILYLIRHGEAYHNVCEREAISAAQALALAEGLTLKDDETIRRIEQARCDVLADPSFFDAPLSEHGHQQAMQASQQLSQWWFHHAESNNSNRLESDLVRLPPPTEVYVSPLYRTLQTADLLFPYHNNIRVREELRERMTGRPADNRPSSRTEPPNNINHRFDRFSFRHLRVGSAVQRKQQQQLQLVNDNMDEMLGNNMVTPPPVPSSERKVSFAESHGDSTSFIEHAGNHDVVENEHDLQLRTSKLLSLLAHSRHDSIAVVTHKGFLRSLERGLLQQHNATEFGNCEIRVYKIILTSPVSLLSRPSWAVRLESVERIK